MSNRAYTRGLHDLGNSVYAYLQPDGSWGWSNAGIIVDGSASLLVDTLYDLKLTGTMLATMRQSIPAAAAIDMLVNTHANGDHCYGNQLVGATRIIASARTAEEMLEMPPERMAMLMKQASALGAFGTFASRIFAPFDFENITLTPPDSTFEGQLDLRVGTKTVRLLEVGPAHTRGDTLVYVPDDKVIFTGDILFVDSHPILWAGPVSNWIRACETILSLEVETIVPGHGPITDKQGVARLKGYFEYLFHETRRCYKAGLSVLDAAMTISMDAYATWLDRERVAINVASIYRELGSDHEYAGTLGLFSLASEYAQRAGL
ncbi:MAG TPA: MBL fold metallo-hydrolase [Ktedonobacteraceae bacterium]|nr:MBL fold metallo-hydrolase [Ktedonobacteraceae bacterium]